MRAPTTSANDTGLDSSAASRLLNGVPPLAAFVYPWLVALGPTLHPALLASTLIVPTLAFWLAYARIDPASYPASRRVAFLAVGSPALFTLLGGWLDGQRLLPFKGLGAWCILWGLLAAIVLLERRAERAQVDKPASPAWMRSVRTAHGISATFIVAFAIVHLCNHMVGLLGGTIHWDVMQLLRIGYRNTLVESFLIACVGFQTVSGVVLVWDAMAHRSDLIRSLQLASAAYLLCFFASHISAVFRARHLRGIDTNWQWLTSSSLLHDAWSARLTPYYWLAIIALGIHAAAGLRGVLCAHEVHGRSANAVFTGVSLTSVVVATLIMTGLIIGVQ